MWQKGCKMVPRVFERVKIMKRYLIISVWLVIFAVAFGLACRKKPQAEKEPPEPNVPAQITPKRVEPKPVTTARPGDVAVTVNGTAITEGEVAAEVQQMASRMPPQYLEQNRDRIRQQTLDRMIVMRLLDEKIKATGIVVTEKEVSEQINQIAAQQGMSLDDFKAMLKTRGMNFDEWKKQMQFERRVQFQKLFEAEFAAQLSVTDNDANNYYAANIKQYATPQQVKASHILIKPDPNGDPNEGKVKALAKAQDLLKQVKAGADFAELAKANSSCPSSTKGGDLGFFGKGRMVPAFDKAVFALNVNEVSDVVETRFGYHIIKATDHKEASTKSFAEAKEDIIKMLKQRKQGELAQKYVASLKAQANIVYPPGKEPRPTPPPTTPTRMPPRPPTRTPPPPTQTPPK
jgi:peptidyl-prolyl cis-trans isomerase C